MTAGPIPDVRHGPVRGGRQGCQLDRRSRARSRSACALTSGPIPRCSRHRHSTGLELRRHEEALGYVEEALSLPEADDLQWRAGLAREAGNLFSATRQFDRAAEMWRRALANYEQVQDTEAIARTKSNLAALSLKDASPEIQDEAAKVLEAISAEQVAHGDLIGLTNNWFHISGHHRRRRNFQAALAYARKDLSLSSTIGNHREVVKSLDNLAMIYLECRQPTAARAAIREARAIGERLGNEAVIANEDRALEVVDDAMREAHLAGEAVGPKAPCACGRPVLYEDCCGRADFDPFEGVPSRSFGVVRNLRPVSQESGASASRLDYFLRDGIDLQDRRAWHRIDAHDGWREIHVLPDAANIHLAAARALAAESKLDPDGVTNPVGALILSVCAVEAFANQTAFFFKEAKSSDDCVLPPLPPELMGDVLEFQRKTSMSEKWKLLGTVMCRNLWPPNPALWDDFLWLVELRNELVHFKSAEYERIVPPPRRPHRMIERLAPSACVRPIAASWPERVLTPALAEWAVSTADQMMKSFRAAYALARRQSDAE